MEQLETCGMDLSNAVYAASLHMRGNASTKARGPLVHSETPRNFERTKGPAKSMPTPQNGKIQRPIKKMNLITRNITEKILVEEKAVVKWTEILGRRQKRVTSEGKGEKDATANPGPQEPPVSSDRRKHRKMRPVHPGERKTIRT